jgi:branched-chain amino acid transport system substrate-binding protein
VTAGSSAGGERRPEQNRQGKNKAKENQLNFKEVRAVLRAIRIFVLSLLVTTPLGVLPTQPADAADNTYDINVVLPLTGAASFLGKGEQKSLQILEGVVNREPGIGGRPVRFMFHDDQSSAQVAVQLLSQITASRPPLILGSAIVAMCNAMAPLVQDGPFMYCFSPGIYPNAGSYVFTSNVATRAAGAAFIRYFRLKGWKKVALITSTDATGQDAEAGIKAAVAAPENASIDLVANAHFNPTDVSVVAQMERIKALSPDVLIAWSTGGAISTVFKAIAQADLQIPIATTYGNMTLAQMKQYANFLPKPLYFSSTPWMENTNQDLSPAVEAAHKRFHGAFKAAGLSPDVSSILSWDPTMLVIEALRKIGPAATAAQLREFFAKWKGYGGVNGIYDFERTPQRGLDEMASVVSEWNPAKNTWDVVSKPTGIPLDAPAKP